MRRMRDTEGKRRTDKEQRELLDRIQALSFAVEETRQFLDGHPYNRMGLAYYGKIKNELDAAMGEYALRYGPLSGLDIGGNEQQGWLWGLQPWPWQAAFPEESDRPDLNEELRPDDIPAEV